jgi:glycosyltransferase involved in cell wall biosynthesis
MTGPRIVAWGTYDLGKPRTRILLRGLRELGVDVVECHADVWAGVEDKSRLRSPGARLRRAAALLAAYPGLVARYLRAPAHAAVLVGYMGHLDVLVLWPWAKLRRRPILWDAFLSLYSTVVEDRKLVPPRHPLALLLRGWEWLACRAADRVVLDTRAHAELFRQLYRVPEEKLAVVPVGAEPDAFFETDPPDPPRRRVLFYGQLIPLHGIRVILEAARLTEGEGIEWLVVGDGQDRPVLEDAVGRPGDRAGPVRWVRWVPYHELRETIAGSAVCLGIFGTSDKAARVVPNKAYQILATGRPLVTRDGPAIRELLGEDPGRVGVVLVPPGDPGALSRAVEAVLDAAPFPADWRERRRELVGSLTPAMVAAPLLEGVVPLSTVRSHEPT